MVNVAVDLDFTERSKAATQVDPKNRVAVSEKTTTSEESTPIIITGGVGGTQANIEDPGLKPVKNTEPATKTMDDSMTQYQVGQTVTQVREDIGHIRGMTVSIVLDFKEMKAAPVEAAAPDAKTDMSAASALNRVPMSDAEKKQIENSVLNAIGYYAALDYQKATDSSIGLDRFKVSTECMDMKPIAEELEIMEANMLSIDSEMLTYIRYAVAVVVVLALLFIARGQLKRSHEAWRMQREQAEESAKKAAEVLANKENSAERAMEKRLAFKDSIKKQVHDNPNAAAEVLKAWLSDA
jgi:flagellar biosynthesis/type III secretory pathway M-ring protein FliF/YscJ